MKKKLEKFIWMLTWILLAVVCNLTLYSLILLAEGIAAKCYQHQ